MPDSQDRINMVINYHIVQDGKLVLLFFGLKIHFILQFKPGDFCVRLRSLLAFFILEFSEEKATQKSRSLIV